MKRCPEEAWGSQEGEGSAGLTARKKGLRGAREAEGDLGRDMRKDTQQRPEAASERWGGILWGRTVGHSERKQEMKKEGGSRSQLLPVSLGAVVG